MKLRSWHLRTPPKNPAITDPIWPGDPFWRSKKYPRKLRAAIAHEYHYAPEGPTLRQLAKKYGIHYGSVAAWVYAYPYARRDLPERTFVSRFENYERLIGQRAEEKRRQYLSELFEYAAKADATWKLMGDPLPSRAAINQRDKVKATQKITLPFVPLMFTIAHDP